MFSFSFASWLNFHWIWQHLFQVGFHEWETCFNISAKFSSFFSFLKKKKKKLNICFQVFKMKNLTHTLSMFCPNLLNFQRSREHSILSLLKNLSTFNISLKYSPILKKLRAFVGLALPWQCKHHLFRNGQYPSTLAN